MPQTPSTWLSSQDQTGIQILGPALWAGLRWKPRGVSCCLKCRHQTLCVCLGSELPEHLPGPASQPSPAYPGRTAGRARESQARARVLQQGGQARPAPGRSPQTPAWTSAPQTLTRTPVTWGPALCDLCIGAWGGGQRGSTARRGSRTAAVAQEATRRCLEEEGGSAVWPDAERSGQIM